MSTLYAFRRPVKPTRRSYKAPVPFGLGIFAPVLIRTRSYGPFVADLFEQEDWFEAVEHERFRYLLKCFREGRLILTKGFDVLGDAEVYQDVLTTPSPEPDLTASGDWTSPDFTHYADEAPELSSDHSDFLLVAREGVDLW